MPVNYFSTLFTLFLTFFNYLSTCFTALYAFKTYTLNSERLFFSIILPLTLADSILCATFVLLDEGRH